jgi:hypothetical protein
MANGKWGYALEACVTDQPAGFGRFSLVRRRYRRHLHRPYGKYSGRNLRRIARPQAVI